MRSNSPPPRPAATVVLLRAARAGFEVLMVRRHSDLAVAGGAIAFPGGTFHSEEAAIDPGSLRSRVQPQAAAAAVRECREEVGLELDPTRLRSLSRWVTPIQAPVRFDTHFFVAAWEDAADPRPDGHEVTEAFWVAPQAILRQIASGGELALPPTIRTLEWLSEFEDVGTVLAAVEQLHEPVEVAPGVQRLRAPNAGVMTGAGTNTYIVGRDQLVVIDPGPDDRGHVEALLHHCGDRLRGLLLTHHHHDHSDAIVRLQESVEAPVPLLGQLGNGELFEVGDVGLRVLATPGHTADHRCYLLEDQGLLFSGDHVLQGSTVAVQPPDGDMSAYLDSLEAVQRVAPSRIAPGHGEMIENPDVTIDEYLRHRLERESQIFELLKEAGSSTASEIAELVYGDLWPVLLPAATGTTWAHLRKLAHEGKAKTTDADDLDATWSAVTQ